MRLWAVKLASLLLILSSCSQGDWAPVSSSVEERITARSVEDVLVIDSRALVLTLALPVEDSYSFSLTDPDGLEWEGSLTPDGGGFYTSDELVLTEGATFREGDYSLSVFNSHGELETLTLTFRHESLPSDVPLLLRDRDVTWRDSEGNTVDDPLSRDGRFQVTTRDSYGNLIVIESVRPSA